MKTSSKILLGISIALLILLVTLFTQYLNETEPDLTEPQARVMLDKLAKAFFHENVGEVLSFAAPDAKVAGRTLEQIRDYLRRAFSQSHNLEVRFRDVQYQRHGNTVTLDAHAEAGERPPGSPNFTDTYYTQPVRFIVQKRSTPFLGGLLRTNQWKIIEVEATNLPHVEGF